MTNNSASEEQSKSDEMILVSANRTEDEKREAYTVEWRDPVDEPSLADQIRSLF